MAGHVTELVAVSWIANPWARSSRCTSFSTPPGLGAGWAAASDASVSKSTSATTILTTAPPRDEMVELTARARGTRRSTVRKSASLVGHDSALLRAGARDRVARDDDATADGAAARAGPTRLPQQSLLQAEARRGRRASGSHPHPGERPAPAPHDEGRAQAEPDRPSAVGRLPRRAVRGLSPRAHDVGHDGP